MIRRLLLGACLAGITLAGAAESKAKLTVEARAKFKALSPKKIKVEKDEGKYLAVYEFAYDKLDTAIIKLDNGKHSAASYACSGFLHYMNQLKGYAFEDELKALYDIQSKVWSDLLTASRSKACKIPLKQVLTDAVINTIPKDAADFRKWVTDSRQDLELHADIDWWDNNYAQPRLSLVGGAEMKWGDGQFRKTEVIKVRGVQRIKEDKVLRKIWMEGGVVRHCRALLLFSQAHKKGDGILMVPFTFTIWRKANGEQGFKDVKVDFNNVYGIAK